MWKSHSEREAFAARRGRIGQICAQEQRGRLAAPGWLALCRDEQVRRLKDKLEQATNVLIDLVIDELFPETGTDADDADSD